MCFLFHDWKYYGDKLRTCLSCGVHQEKYYCWNGTEWTNITCKEFDKSILSWKKEQRKESRERAKLHAEKMNCKYYDHSQNMTRGLSNVQ